MLNLRRDRVPRPADTSVSPEKSLLDETHEARTQQMQARLRRLERRDWLLWWAAVVVILLLTLVLVSLSLPTLFREEDRSYQFNLNQAVRGLVGLVLLFNLYTIYQQILIKRLRRELAEQLNLLTTLQVRADEFLKLAILDPLTGLYNRRFAEQRLEAEVARSQRYNRPLTVLMLDLNDFKQINDRYGHPAGDQVLKEFGERLKSATRVSDVAARLGGDEFVVLLPECPPGQVQHLLERLSPLEVNHQGKKIPVTFASGWAGYQAGELGEHLLERADQALYAEKRTAKSRNQSIASVS